MKDGTNRPGGNDPATIGNTERDDASKTEDMWSEYMDHVRTASGDAFRSDRLQEAAKFGEDPVNGFLTIHPAHGIEDPRNVPAEPAIPRACPEDGAG